VALHQGSGTWARADRRGTNEFLGLRFGFLHAHVDHQERCAWHFMMCPAIRILDVSNHVMGMRPEADLHKDWPGTCTNIGQPSVLSAPEQVPEVCFLAQQV